MLILKICFVAFGKRASSTKPIPYLRFTHNGDMS